jgi:hypothetical protein
MEDMMKLTDQEARMRGQAPDRVRRVSVTDPIAAARRYDYADAFELRLERPDRCSPEEWVRAGVDATPAWIKRIAAYMAAIRPFRHLIVYPPLMRQIERDCQAGGATA